MKYDTPDIFFIFSIRKINRTGCCLRFHLRQTDRVLTDKFPAQNIFPSRRIKVDMPSLILKEKFQRILNTVQVTKIITFESSQLVFSVYRMKKNIFMYSICLMRKYYRGLGTGLVHFIRYKGS